MLDERTMLKTYGIISITTVSLLLAFCGCVHGHVCDITKHHGMCSGDPKEKASTTDYLDKQINEYKTDFPGAIVRRAVNEIRIILPSDSILQKESSEFLPSGENNLKKKSHPSSNNTTIPAL